MMPVKIRNIIQNYPFFQAYLSGKINREIYINNLKLFRIELLQKGLSESDLQNLSDINSESNNINLKKIRINGKEHTLETLETKEILELSRKLNGKFNGDWGIYLILMDGKNDKQYSELVKEENLHYLQEVFIGQIGIFKTEVKHPITGKLIYKGPQLEDFLVSDKFQRQGYMFFLIKEAIKVLKERGYQNACVINANEKSQQLLLKLKQNGMNITTIFQSNVSNKKIRNIYIINF